MAGAHSPARVQRQKRGNRDGACMTFDWSGPVPAHVETSQSKVVSVAVNTVIGILIFDCHPPLATSLMCRMAPRALLASCIGLLDRVDLNAQRAW